MTAHAATPALAQRTLTATASALRHLFAFLARNARGAHGAREAERLFAMSDAELARLGIRRGDIMYHAFGPRIHI